MTTSVMEQRASSAPFLPPSPKPTYSDAELKGIWRAKVTNINNAWAEFENREAQVYSMPFKGTVELTQNCNYKCIMCAQSWVDAFKKPDPRLNMPMETFLKVADELFPWAMFVDLAGFGEVTQLPYWPEIVDRLAYYPFVEWHLLTNASLEDAEIWDRMVRLNFTMGLSIDGATAPVFEAIRRGGDFASVRRNLGVIRDAIARHGKGHAYFVSTIQKKNVHEMRKLVELAREFGVPEVQFKLVNGGGPKEARDGGHDEGLRDYSPEAMKSHVSAAIDAAREPGLSDVKVSFNDPIFTRHIDDDRVLEVGADRPRSTKGPYPDTPEWDPDFWDEVHRFHEVLGGIQSSYAVSTHQRCFKPFSFTYVNFRGEVGACNHMMFPNMLKMGDIGRDSLSEIWNSDRYRELRESLLHAVPRDPRCKQCFKNRLGD